MPSPLSLIIIQSMSTNFLTREGYDKLIAELQELKQEKLPAVLERLAEAKAM